MGIPNVKDKNCTMVIAIVPRFMFDGIIKGKSRSHFPFAGFAADAEAAFLWHD